jgi:hypothetical protein
MIHVTKVTDVTPLPLSGLPIDAQATLLELLEAQGLPPVCVTMALREDGMRLLGELMAAAVQAQRGKQTTPRAPAPWDAAGPAAAAAGGGIGGDAPRSGSSGSTNTGKESGGVTLRRGDMTLSGLPGRRGRLFASSSKSQQTQQRGSSSSRDAGTANLGGGAATGGTGGTGGAATGGTGGATALPDGLQPLQELIPPAVARRRLQVCFATATVAVTSAALNASAFQRARLHACSRDHFLKILGTLCAMQVPANPRSSKTDSSSSSSSSSSESAAAAVFDQLQPDSLDDTLTDLLEWVSDESTGPSVELPFSSISNSGKGDTAASEVAADSAADDDDNDTSAAAVAASTDAAVPLVGNSLQTLRSSSVNSAQSASGYPSPPADDASITNLSLDDIFDSIAATSPQPGTQLRQMGISGGKDLHTTSAVADGDEADDDDAYAQVDDDANSVIGDHQAQAISHQAAGGDEGTDLLDPEPAAMSALQAVRAALSAGVSPEQLSAAMRQAVAAGAAATDPVDLLLQEGDAAAAAAATAAGAATTIDERSKHNSASSRAGGDSGAEQLITTPSLVVEPAASAPSNADLGPTPANLQQQQQQQPARVVRATYGPEPPPPAAQQQQQHDADGDAPLLRLRPEIENALRNQQVKFLDMSKLPSKYRRRYERPQQQHPSQQGHQQQQQEQQEQQQQQQEPQHTRRWWASDQRSATRAQLLMSLSGGVSGSLPRGGRVEAVDTGTAQDGLLPQQQMPADSGALLHDGDCDGGDDDDNQGLVAEESPRLIELQQQEQQQQDLLLDGPKLLALRDGTVAAGLDVRVALARAAAYGIIIDDEAAANLGLDMPTAEEVLAARAEIVDSLRDTDHGNDGLELDDVKEEEEEEGA